jgi:hypothetical protein
MNTKLKGILSAMGVAALLASPAMAKTTHHHHGASSAVPSDARGAATHGSAIRYSPYGFVPRVPTESGPYTPDIPTPAHGLNPDFQDGSRG